MIDKLTPEQEKMLPEYRRVGIEIGLATGPEMDEAKVKELTDAHREMAGVKKAEIFKVYDSPFAACKDIPGINPGNALYGQHDISWLINHQFFRTDCGLIEETKQIFYLMELAKRVGWMWMSGNTTIVTRRPKTIHMLDTKVDTNNEVRILKVLHNPTGMALEYADGTGLYSLYGTRLTKEYQWLVTENGKYDISRVLNISNAAIKTIGLRVLGPKALITAGTAIDKWSSKVGGEYTLYSVIVNENNRLYLSGECPSKHEPFCEAVPPTIKTCKQALAWREEEVNFDDYTEPSVRT